MNIATSLSQVISQALNALYSIEQAPSDIVLQETRRDFSGDYTLVVFPFVKQARKSPETLANEIGTHVIQHLDLIKNYNVVKGFLNFQVADTYWLQFVAANAALPGFGLAEASVDAPPVVVEFSSPNTNKPLHLGHIRNNLLG
ncbi:MAG: arginine--tRNA ligase, partial [Bacteroidales bacterium]|nr:arginine--tRNA ligase [Bacteroidales bacterium]